MKDNIVYFPGTTRHKLPVERVMAMALEADLESVVIIGETKDGKEYFTSSTPSGVDVLWMLERAKFKLLHIVDEMIGDDDEGDEA